MGYVIILILLACVFKMFIIYIVMFEYKKKNPIFIWETVSVCLTASRYKAVVVIITRTDVRVDVKFEERIIDLYINYMHKNNNERLINYILKVLKINDTVKNSLSSEDYLYDYVHKKIAKRLSEIKKHIDYF